MWRNGRTEVYASVPGIPSLDVQERTASVERGLLAELVGDGVLFVADGKRVADVDVLLDHLPAVPIEGVVADRFAAASLADLGIDTPTVGSGAYSEMTISTALTPQPENKGDAADGTAAALTPVQANPRRISARLSLAVEDVAQVGQANFEAALRAHTSAALSDAYDNQCINGSGTAPNVNGLIAQLTDPTNPTAVADFDAFVSAAFHASRVGRRQGVAGAAGRLRARGVQGLDVGAPRVQPERLSVVVECRASESGPMLRGVILQEGRAATGGRREVFAPRSVTWPADGIAIRGEHRGPELARAVPTREAGGVIRVEARATPEIFAAVEGGRRFMSVEFFPLQERTTADGVRELQRAMLDGAALVREPEYDSTCAEVRSRRSPGRRWWAR